MATYDMIPATDLIDNPSPRCACMVILDTSYSMNGAPIQELNSGIQHFIASVQEDEVAGYSVEIGVISAGASVSEILPFTTANNIETIQSFHASGETPLGQAVELALQLLEARKKEYQKSGVAYYQPWLVVISDGAPSDTAIFNRVAPLTHALSSERKLVVLPIGVANANMQVLGKLSSRGAKKLDGLKFNEFFEWLSASMSRVSASASTSSSIQLPTMDSWDSI